MELTPAMQVAILGAGLAILGGQFRNVAPNVTITLCTASLACFVYSLFV